MNHNVYKNIMNLHYQTALLEVFDWDEEVLEGFNSWFVDSIRSAYDPQEFAGLLISTYGKDVFNIVRDMIKFEINELKMKGAPYEA